MRATLIFLLGLGLGSFLNVIIYRLPRGESFSLNRSYCPQCERTLEVKDLIPVISFVLAGGKCRYCEAKISYRYPLLEILMGVILLALYIQLGLSYRLVSYGVLCFLLVACGLIDWNWMIIPNKLTLPGIALGLLGSFLWPQISIYEALLGVLAPAAALLLVAIISRGGLGMGDIKLVALIGSFLGVWPAFLSVFTGALLGSLFAGWLVIKGEKGLKSKLPFGIFLALAGIIMVFWSSEITEFYVQLIN